MCARACKRKEAKALQEQIKKQQVFFTIKPQSDMIKKVIKDMHLPANILYPFVKMGARVFGHFNLEETSPYQEVQKSRLPIIFFHGTNDSLVPC